VQSVKLPFLPLNPVLPFHAVLEVHWVGCVTLLEDKLIEAFTKAITKACRPYVVTLEA